MQRIWHNANVTDVVHMLTQLVVSALPTAQRAQVQCSFWNVLCTLGTA